MRYILASTILLGLTANTLWAGAPTASTRLTSIDHDKEYLACVKIASKEPATALKAAQYWFTQGGGTGAEHCQAVAHLKLKQYREAATILERVAMNMDADITPGQRSSLLAESAKSYKMAGQPQRGLPLLERAISYSPDMAEYYVQRGVLLAVNKDYDRAITDFTRVIQINPQYAQAYTYRANTYRYLGNVNRAMADIQQAAALMPNNTDTLLERGVLHAIKGDKTAASQDWNKILEIAKPNDPALQAAKINLEKLRKKS